MTDPSPASQSTSQPTNQPPGGPPPGWTPPPGQGVSQPPAPQPPAPQPGQPGYGPPPGYGQAPGGYPTGPGTGPPGGSTSTVSGSTWWALLAVVGIAVAVSVPEDGSNEWKSIGVWAGFAIAAALATLVPAARDSLKLAPERAWQVAAGGFVGLAFFWILFVLPSISQNISFVATMAVAAAGLAVWSAPGRPSDGPGTSSGGEWW